jgi:2-polyprenyl-6-hydroxyphenyl methylase/3-demethylubiquinone-9 3-methyltransferase
VLQAEVALKGMLEVESLENRRFLDVGSGSGLSSLAARRLGARVHSFDFDPQSVACTKELRRRYFGSDDEGWTIEEGSALDAGYIQSLGVFDVVYSWGVLHHTGEMWTGLANMCLPVGPGGKLFIAIYNNTGSQSARWKWIKRVSNRVPSLLHPVFVITVMAPGEVKKVLRSVLTLNLNEYVRSWTQGGMRRGMSRWHDMIDWVGGYPYEVAKPEEIFDFYRARGFTLTKLRCGGVGLGCNEFVFSKGEESGGARRTEFPHEA